MILPIKAPQKHPLATARMTAQICATMTSCLHSADVMEIVLTYFIHDEINMIPCSYCKAFVFKDKVLKSSKFKTLEILQDFKDIYSTAKVSNLKTV